MVLVPVTRRGQAVQRPGYCVVIVGGEIQNGDEADRGAVEWDKPNGECLAHVEVELVADSVVYCSDPKKGIISITVFDDFLEVVTHKQSRCQS